MSSQSTHNYYSRSSNHATNCTTSTPDDSNPIPETKLLTRFNEVQDKRLRKRVSFLDKKVISFESRVNMLEKYGRRNNLQVTGSPD